MTDILEGKHGVYNLDKREDCYAYLCREAGLNGQQLSMLERIYSTPAPAEVERLVDEYGAMKVHIGIYMQLNNNAGIKHYRKKAADLKSRLLAALSNTTPDIIKKKDDAIRGAINQIEYLHEKFRETGSGNTVIARLEDALSNTTPYLSGDVKVPVEKLEQDLEQYITLGSTGCRTIAEDVEFNRLHSKFLAAFRKAAE